jgi:hypothetical protein
MDAVKRASACLNEIRANASSAEIEVIDRLLGDRLEMSSVWEELDDRFPAIRRQPIFCSGRQHRSRRRDRVTRQTEDRARLSAGCKNRAE